MVILNQYIQQPRYSCKKSQNVFSIYIQYLYYVLGHAVAQLVEALRYKSEGRGFVSRWCHWNFSLT